MSGSCEPLLPAPDPDIDWAKLLADGPGQILSIPEPVTITDALHLDLTARIASVRALWSTLTGFLGVADTDIPEDIVAWLHHAVIMTIATIGGAADEAEYFNA